MELAIEAVNVVVADVPVTWALHVCYGNRYARPLWEGHYDFLFPAVLDAAVDQLLLEFARKGDDDLALIEKHGWDRVLGVGVLDVKTAEVESVPLVERRIERALADRVARAAARDARLRAAAPPRERRPRQAERHDVGGRRGAWPPRRRRLMSDLAPVQARSRRSRRISSCPARNPSTSVRNPPRSPRTPAMPPRSPVTSVRSSVTSDRSTVTSDRTSVTSVRSSVTSVRSPVTSDRTSVTSDRSTVTSVRSSVTSDRSPVTSVRSP